MRSSLGKLGGGMKAAYRQREVARPLPRQPHCHIACEHELLEQPRIVQGGVERRSALVEVDYAHGVHLQAQQVVVAGGKNRRDLGQNQQPQARAELQHQRQVRGDQRRSAPGNLRHRPEQVMALGGREDLVQVADDLRSVADRVAREQDAVERVILQSRPQHVLIESAI